MGTLTVTIDAANAGVLLVADFTADPTVPTRVRFVRVDPDGSEQFVRSGDPALAPGGYAIAYDHEAPLGVALSWYAVPILDGVDGTPTGMQAGEVTAPVAYDDVWLKALDQLDLSMLVTVNAWAALDTEGQSSTARPFGATFPHATVHGRRTAPTSQMVALTDTIAARHQMDELLDQGLLLAQTRPDYGRPDQYVLVGAVSEDAPGAIGHPLRQWTVALTAVRRPATLDDRLRVPGHSYQHRLDLYPTYADVPARDYSEALTG